MTEKEVRKTIRIMNKVAKEAIKSKKETLELLIATGSYTKKGNLKKAYK